MALEILKKLISFKSITPNEAGAYEYIQNLLSQFEVLDLSFEGCATRNIMLFRIYNAKKEKCLDEKSIEHLCFCGHVDVVPPGGQNFNENWINDAFIAHESDGKLFGRGTQDMKGQLACVIKALKENVDNSDKSKKTKIISLLLTSDEEGDGEFGIKYALEKLKKDHPHLIPTNVIVTEPTSDKNLGDKIKVGRKGSISGIITIHGKQGHVAYPRSAINPIDLLGARLGNLAGNHLDSGLRSENGGFAPSKFVITHIQAGVASNVVPGVLTLKFSVRNNPNVNEDAIKDYVKSALNGIPYELTLKVHSTPFIAKRSEINQILKEGILKYTGQQAKDDTGGGSSDAKWFAKHEIPCVEFGGLNDTIHAVNERIEISELTTLVKIYSFSINRFLSI